MAWHFDWHRRWGDVWNTAFEATWWNVFDRATERHVYHRPDVVRAWAETCGQSVDVEPMLGFGSDGDGHHAVLPWVVVTYTGRLVQRRVLEPVGGSLFCYHDPLVASEQAGDARPDIDWSDFWYAARRGVGSRCDQALFRFIDPGRCGGVPTEPCGDESPILRLTGLPSLDALLERCSANHRNDIRRRLRRLGECGDVTVWEAGVGDVDVALTDFRAHFARAYRGVWAEQPNLFDRPGFPEFAERILRDGIPAGWGQYAVLRVSGTPVAWHLGLVHERTLYWSFPTYDKAWEHFSPGKVLLAKLIEDAIARGWTTLHFLTGGQPYKLAWRPERPGLRAIRWRSPGFRRALFAVYDALHHLRPAEPQVNRR